MHSRSTITLAALALACAVAAHAQAPGASSPAAVAQQLPVTLFFRPADLGDARLSPSGKRLAVSAANGGRVGLGVIDLDGGGAPRLLARYDDADVDTFAWVNDEHLVYTVVDRELGSGDQRFAAGLFSVEVSGGAPRELVRPRRDFVTNRSSVGRQPLEWNHTLLAVPEDGGNEVIVGRWAGEIDLREVIPLRLDVSTLHARSLGMGMPAGAMEWLFDRRGEPRIAAGIREGKFSVHWRPPRSEEWRLLATMPTWDRSWAPLSVDDDGGLYVTVPEGPAATAALRRYDFAANRPAAGEPMVRTAGFDFDGSLIQDWGGGAVLGVRTETDAETTVWFDKRLAEWQAVADKRLPGRVNRLDCRRCAGADPVLLVRSWSDRQPSEFWVFRPLREGGSWSLVGKARGDVDPRRMATLDFHRVNTRDGLSMPVWLTLPPGADAKTRRPAVLMVHGGPWVRGGHWRWEPYAQFLASRGYVVIEPEFRGSTGYGGRLFQAGRKQWGKAMEDDLADALQWAVAQGWVDGARVCIAGGSYGGYAALMGPIRYPDLFRCVVAWVAVSDPRLMYTLPWSDAGEEALRYQLPELLGDPKADAALLAEVSPLTQAARLKVPVFLAFGGADLRVPIAHGERMRDALKAAGNPPLWVEYPDEGHGWLKPQNRFDFARRIESFLERNLRPAEPAPR